MKAFKKFMIAFLFFLLLFIGGSVLFGAVAKAVDLQTTSQNDWFELEKKPVAWVCDAPLVEGYNTEGEESYMFCNTTKTPTEFTLDKPCLGQEWDFTKPISKETAFSKVGGFNHYRYCINEISLKNPTTDFVSTDDFKFTISDMNTGIYQVDFLIENPEDPNELIRWEKEHKVSWDKGLELKLYAYGIKYDKQDTIEWDFELTYKPENITFYKDPFWDGAGGDQSHLTLVPDNKFWVEDFEGFIAGEENPSPYTNSTPDPDSTQFTIYDDGAGNKFINISGSDTVSTSSLDLAIGTNFGANFTVYFKKAQFTALGGYGGYRWSVGTGEDDEFVQTNSATKFAYLYTVGGSDLPIMGSHSADTWYFMALNYTRNSTNDGVLTWIGIDDDGSGDWDLGVNSTNQGTTDLHSIFRLYLVNMGAGNNHAWDNLFVAQVPDYNLLDNETTNLSCAYLYSDAGNTPINTQTVQFYKNGTLWKTLHNTAPNSSNRGWSVNITESTEDYTVYCNLTVCDTGGECDSEPNSNEIFIVGTTPPNNPPVMDIVNISSALGFNTTTENLLGGFNWSDPDADSWTNETLWWKDGSTVAALNNLQEVSSSNTTIGETWAFSARVNDGTVWSDWKNSTNLTILSSNPIISFVACTDLNLTDDSMNLTCLINITSPLYAINTSSFIFYHGINHTHSVDQNYNWSWVYPASGRQPLKLRGVNRNRSFTQIDESAMKFYGADDIWSFAGLQNILGRGGNKIDVYDNGTTWSAFNFSKTQHLVFPQHFPVEIKMFQKENRSQFVDVYKNHYAMLEFDTLGYNENATIYFHVGIDDRDSTAPLQFYICNETIDLTTDVTSDSNCLFTGTKTDFSEKEDVWRNSTKLIHWVVGIDGGGYLIGNGGLKVTNHMFLSLYTTEAAASKAYKLYYLNNSINGNTNYNETYLLRTTNTVGWTWINNSNTPDAYVISQTDEDTLMYYVKVCDDQGGCTNSSIQYDVLGPRLNESPSAPFLQQPLANYNLSGVYNVSWLEGVDPEGDNFTTTVILQNISSEFVLGVLPNGTVNLSFNTTPYRDGSDWNMTIYHCDSWSCSYNDTSEGFFTIDNIPQVTNLKITSNDPLTNFTNATFTGSWGWSDTTGSHTWQANSSLWFNGSTRIPGLDNVSALTPVYTNRGETWILQSAVQSSDGSWSENFNTSLSVLDFSPNITSPVFNDSIFYEFQDIGFTFTVEDIDNEPINVSLNITNNGVTIIDYLITGLNNGDSYKGNVSQTYFNATHSIDVRVNASNPLGSSGIFNSTTQITTATVTATDQWKADVNETSGMNYYLNITESYGYPYKINISAKFYRGSLSYTPTTLSYRTNNLTRFNVTIPTPLTAYNYTNYSSRWEWNYTTTNGLSSSTTTSRNQTVWHAYFITNFYSTPSNLLEAERFLARVNYSSLQLATISNSTFELTGLNFSAALNGTTQFYNNQVYTSLLPDSLNSSTYTLSANANFTYLDQSFLRNKNTTVTVNKMIITHCGGLSNMTMHVFELYNESEPQTRENGTIKITYEYFQDRLQQHRNFSGESSILSESTNSTWNYTFCIWPTWATFAADTTIQYDGDGFAPRTYYHYNKTFSNMSQTDELYMISDALDTAINVYLLDQDDNPISKALLNVKRFYPEEGLYRSVQVSESDANGLALIKVQLIDVLYKLIMEQSGLLLDQTDKFPFIDSNYYFRINILSDFLDSWNKVGALNTQFTVNNDTGLGSFYWSDNQNIVQTGCLEVFTRSGFRDQRLSYQCLNATIGTLTYTVNTSVEGRYMFRSTIETNTNNTEYYMETRELFIENASAIFGLLGVFLTILMFVGLSMAGLSHNPSTQIIFGTGTLLAMVVLGFIYFPWVGVITLMITAIFVVYMIRT